MRNFKEKLKKTSVVIVSHIHVTGPSHFLEDFLKKKVKNLIFIGHPFLYSQDIRSFFRQHKKGKVIKRKYAPPLKLLGVLYYLKDIFYTFYWLIFLPATDVFVGVDNLNACCGLLLKKLGKIKRVVFYTIDYIPQRSPIKVLNSLYHFLDRLAVRYSDKVWNLSSIMAIEREKRGIEKKHQHKQLTVPIGANLTIRPKPFEKINRYEIVYLGHVIKRQGVQLVISALPAIIKEIPQVKLVLIGGGAYIPNLKRLAQTLKVRSRIEFTGYVKDHRVVEERLALAAIAVAPYVDQEDNFVRYTDPGKVKNYLAAGLPVVITKVPKVAWELEREKCGFAVEYNKKDMTSAIVKLLKDDQLLKFYRRNAWQLAQKYSWPKIFSKALSMSF